MASLIKFITYSLAPIILILFIFASNQDLLLGALIIWLIIYFYLFPWIVSLSRSHPNSLSIFALNLFLGWTLIGWVSALVWGLFKAP